MDNTVETLSIKGLRGFAKNQNLKLAQPTGTAGSGLTILVGPNNGGKSTIIEAFGAVFSREPLSFSEGKRNKEVDARISLRVKFASYGVSELCTVPAGGSQTYWPQGRGAPPQNCFWLPSRRTFNPYFGAGSRDRGSYMDVQGNALQGTRSSPLADFPARLFNVIENLDEFNAVLKQVVNPVPKWTIDQSDQGQYYVKLDAGGQHHTSDGVGDGIVSLLFIVDALYDSKPGQLIVIDEPELSLQPTFQRRLAHLFAEYAKDRQIVYATHSPHFVDFKFVVNGAQAARVHKVNHRCVVSHLRTETAEAVGGLLGDDNNPHTLGLDAREALFREDGVIVVEGQEDVIYYPRILVQLAEMGLVPCCLVEEVSDRLFGWGAGGADKVRTLLALFRDLGFTQVTAILDGDKRHMIPELREKFPQYDIHAIPADDVRSKPCRPAQGATCGLLDDDRQLKPEFQSDLAELFNSLPNPGLPEGTTTENLTKP